MKEFYGKKVKEEELSRRYGRL